MQAKALAGFLCLECSIWQIFFSWSITVSTIPIIVRKAFLWGSNLFFNKIDSVKNADGSQTELLSFTVIVTVAVLEHPFCVTVTVYVVVTVGVAVGFWHGTQFNPDAGD